MKDEKENYEKGVGYFDEKKWESAKEAFEKIADTSEYYEEAQEKLKTIAEKIEAEEKAKAQVKGVKTTASPAAPTSQPTAIPTPTISQTGLTPNQEAVLKAIQGEIERNNARMSELVAIMNRESQFYCRELIPDYQAADACELERARKYGAAEGEYLGLKARNQQLAIEALRIAGQR